MCIMVGGVTEPNTTKLIHVPVNVNNSNYNLNNPNFSNLNNPNLNEDDYDKLPKYEDINMNQQLLPNKNSWAV